MPVRGWAGRVRAANSRRREGTSLATITLGGVGAEPVVVLAGSRGVRLFSLGLAWAATPVVIALLFAGGPAAAMALVFIGFALLVLFRTHHKRTIFRCGDITHRGVWVESSIPASSLARLWFQYGGGTAVLIFHDGRGVRFAVEERAIGSDLAAKRAEVAATLVGTIGAPYAGITTADPPPLEPAHRLVPMSRMKVRFARLLPSEWAVVVGTVVLSVLSLVGSRS